MSTDSDGESKFKAVAEAYRTLRRQESRTAYDRQALSASVGGAFDWTGDPFGLWPGLYTWPVWGWFSPQ